MYRNCLCSLILFQIIVISFFIICLADHSFDYEKTISNIHILKTDLAVFIFVFSKSFGNVIGEVWEWARRKSYVLNKFYFVCCSITYLLHFIFVLLQIMSCYFLQCFCLDTQTDLWILFSTLLWRNDNYSLVYCASLQELLFVIYILHYRHYICQFNDSDLEPYLIFLFFITIIIIIKITFLYMAWLRYDLFPFCQCYHLKILTNVCCVFSSIPTKQSSPL